MLGGQRKYSGPQFVIDGLNRAYAAAFIGSPKRERMRL